MKQTQLAGFPNEDEHSEVDEPGPVIDNFTDDENGNPLPKRQRLETPEEWIAKTVPPRQLQTSFLAILNLVFEMALTNQRPDFLTTDYWLECKDEGIVTEKTSNGDSLLNVLCASLDEVNLLTSTENGLANWQWTATLQQLYDRACGLYTQYIPSIARYRLLKQLRSSLTTSANNSGRSASSPQTTKTTYTSCTPVRGQIGRADAQPSAGSRTIHNSNGSSCLDFGKLNLQPDSWLQPTGNNSLTISVQTEKESGRLESVVEYDQYVFNLRVYESKDIRKLDKTTWYQETKQKIVGTCSAQDDTAKAIAEIVRRTFAHVREGEPKYVAPFRFNWKK